MQFKDVLDDMVVWNKDDLRQYKVVYIGPHQVCIRCLNTGGLSIVGRSDTTWAWFQPNGLLV